MTTRERADRIFADPVDLLTWRRIRWHRKDMTDKPSAKPKTQRPPRIFSNVTVRLRPAADTGQLAKFAAAVNVQTDQRAS